MKGLPAVAIGLVLIAVTFQVLNPYFLTPRNLTNLLLQIAALGTISTGLVLVLLLGEIDLSAGAVSGLCAAVMAVASVKLGLGGALAIVAAVACGALIGLLQGLWITRFAVPSFVLTLAGLLGWQGALLGVLGDSGTVNLTDPAITALAGTFLGPVAGLSVAAASVGLFVFAGAVQRRARTTAQLPVAPLRTHLARVAAVTAIVAVPTIILSLDRGVPVVFVLMVGLIASFDLLARRTRWGRHVFAVGGNADAARRAGIAVDRVRISVFVLASAIAAFGGVLAASRLLAVNQSSGGGDVLLNAIAAAVIGGTSLFGGRGTVWSALLGSLVIGSISNGMDLLALASPVKFIVTGVALLLAVTLDALGQRK